MLYNLGERFAMEKWWSGAYCVRYLKTYQAMPTRYKVLDLNLILSPLVVTVVAFYYHAVRHVGWIWPWLPAPTLLDSCPSGSEVIYQPNPVAGIPPDQDRAR